MPGICASPAEGAADFAGGPLSASPFTFLRFMGWTFPSHGAMLKVFFKWRAASIELWAKGTCKSAFEVYSKAKLILSF